MMIGTQTRVLPFLVNRCVRDVLGALLALWVVLEAGMLPNSLYGFFMPLWAPTHLAVTVGMAVSDVASLASGSSLLFGAVVMFVTYVEAVALASLVRYFQAIYATYQRGQPEHTAS